MFSGDEQDITKAKRVEVLGLSDHLGDGEGGAQDRVIPGKSAVGAVVDAFVGDVERRVEADGFAKVLAGEVPATHGHGFQLGS